MKNEIKSGYLQRIRKESAYPAFRNVVNALTFIMYFFGLMLFLFSLGIVGGGVGAGLGFFGVVGAVVIIIGAKVFQEVALMIADLVDSMIDFNSRHDQQP